MKSEGMNLITKHFFSKNSDLQSTIRSNLITKQQHLYDFVITRQFMIQDSIHLLNNNIETQSSANDKNNKEKRIEIPEVSVTSKTKETK